MEFVIRLNIEIEINNMMRTETVSAGELTVYQKINLCSNASFVVVFYDFLLCKKSTERQFVDRNTI